MGQPHVSIVHALQAIEAFTGEDLGNKVHELEWSVRGLNGAGCLAKAKEMRVTSDLLSAAYAVKRAAAQINTLIHAVGGLMLLTKIIEEGEHVTEVSLGAGNTGKEFDLVTDRRVAEFKFIHWRGGTETMRKKALFKDFFRLAEAPTSKKRELYLLGTSHALKFLRSGTSLDSVMSKNVPLLAKFRERYGDKFATVGHYYESKQHDVAVIDASPLLPELVRVVAVAEAAADESEE